MAQIVPIRLYRETDFTLGEVRVQPSLNRLSARGRTARLEPKIMKVLVVLWRAKGAVVAREDLIREVWEGQAVTDDAITRCISRLRRLFAEEFPGAAEIETVQKTGYRLLLKGGAWDAAASAPPSQTASRKTAGIGIVLAAVIAALGWLAWRETALLPADRFPAGIRPFATAPGHERYPAFSPDGQSAAFSWRPAEGGDYDLYRVDTEGEGRLRLTTDAANDIWPAWSPDGTRIAFARVNGEAGVCAVLVMPAIGGAARKVAECRGRIKALAWGKGGEILLGVQEAPYAKARLFRILPETAASMEIALPPEFPLGVDDAAFSPDGRLIALSLSPTLGVEDIYVMPAAGGEPRRLTAKHLKVHGLAWAPDGAAVFASTNWHGAFGLWRVPLDGGEPERVLNAASGIDHLSVSSAGDVLVEHWTESASVFAFDLETGEGAPLPFNSTRFDWDARPAPAGGKTAFVSDRSGAAELWLHDGENGTLLRLTDFGGAWTQSPRFSPDGQTLVFASPAEGRFNLYRVSVEGGAVEALTENAGDNFAPAFSPDGKFLYFGSDRTGQWQIWRRDLESGAEAQVTAAGGRAARVSPDGRFLYYTRIDQSGIWREPLGAPNGGPELVTDALTPVDWNNWEVLDGAILYVRRPIPEEPELARLDLETGASRVLLKIPDLLHNSGLWADSAGATAWLTLSGPAEADLMLLPGGD